MTPLELMVADIASAADDLDATLDRALEDAVRDRIRAELRAKSIAAHPSRVARRNEVDAENLRRRGPFVAGPSPADRVAEFDARVIDLAERRGGRK